MLHFRLVLCTLLALVLRGVRALQGDSYCSSTMCIRAFLNGTQWTYQMHAKLGENGFGWMAIGFGNSMTDSQMVIMWPNRDGSVTLSQRAASAHTEPRVVQNPARVATRYLELSSQTSSETNLAFTIPPDGQTSQHIVWAIATTRPTSGAVDATLNKHVSAGGVLLDLSRTFTENTAGTAAPTSGPNTYLPPFPTGSSGGNSPFQLPALLPYQKMLMAHAILCGIGFLIVLPIGALIGRWLRLVTNSWFRAHWFFQALLGLPIIFSGWFLAVAGVGKKEGRHFDDTHKILGLVLIGIYVLQLLLGVHIHLYRIHSNTRPGPIAGTQDPSLPQLIQASNRPFLNYIHAIVGLTIIALSFYQVYLGITFEWEYSTGRGEAPPVTHKLWTAWVVILPVIYFVGLALLPKQLRKERKDAQKSARGSDALPLRPSPPASNRTFRGHQISNPIPMNKEEIWQKEEATENNQAHDVMSEDSHATHSMRPVQNAHGF